MTSLAQAIDLARRGDEDGARRAAEAALAASPADAAILHFLGVMACRAGDLPAGVTHLRGALAAEPANDAARVMLARALIDIGQIGAASEVAAYKGAAGPAEIELKRIAGYAAQARGDGAGAIEAYRAVVAREPGDWESWNNLGNALRLQGDGAGAVEALRRALAIRPSVGAIHFNLGAALADNGDLDGALTAYAEAARLDPVAPEPVLEAGRVLRHLARHDEALRALDRAATLAPASATPLLERARTLVSVQRFAEAEEAYERVLALPEPGPEAFLELAFLLERTSRLDALPGLIARGEELRLPEDAIAYLRALLLRREGKLEEALAAARQSPADFQPERRARLIGKLADKLGRSREAFDAFAEMNRIAAADQPEMRAAATAYRDQIAADTALMTRAWVDSWRTATPDTERPAPTFLVAFPRSGTTLLDTLLMGHPDTVVLEEEALLQQSKDALGDLSRLADLDDAGATRLRGIYFEALDALIPAERTAGKLVIDKLPLNILGAPLIRRIFPDARFIFALRHPCDVVLSCFMQNFELNPAMANFLDLGDAATLYNRVMTFWERSRALLPLAVHETRYEDVVADTERTMRPLIAFLGLEWDDRLLDNQRTAKARGAILTPSYDQVTERIYADAAGRWALHRDRLADVLPVLAPWAGKFGYDL
ncbi:tetratricopeptide repeat-containing sulfotransferase family protein [Allosphingosinicella indica]|uniref:Flp pilus assembly protein TadD, contains TPR repeats n=1 Tax=Allosphingosinicella indica TaxID=941907 RepID=A0A1X7FZH8_9SPHN|nr:tetratricopeptide repeat-containing sulfotransferase family protein [Allosphingosinicella indica]SMF61502.1 Flp pilus assembly protein TadD, contains TPR repeats [Allosphingosinicella indica]